MPHIIIFAIKKAVPVRRKKQTQGNKILTNV